MPIAAPRERAYWFAWSTVTGVGPVLLKRLYEHFGSMVTAWGAPASALLEIDGIGLQGADAVSRQRDRLDPMALLQRQEQIDSHFWTPADPGYPRLLFEIADPPPILYWRGPLAEELNHGSMPAVGIVGTRNPSEYGRRWTRKLSIGLTQTGFTIVSGLAEGIDREAHQSCLAYQGKTVAVLGTGVDVVYPRINQDLQSRIAETGLLLSELPRGTPPERAHFPRRNRIISGLCRAVLVTEAPQRSGALISAQLANEYGREVYALPGSLDNPRSRGCLDLIQQGCSMVLGVDELVTALGGLPHYQASGVPATSAEAAEPSATLDPDLRTVLLAVAGDPVGLDHIVQKSGLETAIVLSALVQLELMGLVHHQAGMRYQRTA